MSLLEKLIPNPIGGKFKDMIDCNDLVSQSIKSIMPGQPCDPVGDMIYRKLSEKIWEVIFEDRSKNSPTITKEDCDNISRMIDEGRKKNLEELEIKISKDLGFKLEATAGLPVEVPINVSAQLCKNSQGEYSIKVRYLPKTIEERLYDLKELHEKRLLTDEEYTEAKRRIIEKI